MKIKYAIILAGSLSVVVFSCKKDDTKSSDSSGYCSINSSKCISTLHVVDGDSTIIDYAYSSEHEIITIKNRKTGIVINESTNPDALTTVTKIWNTDGTYQATAVLHFSENGNLDKEEFYPPDSLGRYEYIYRYNSAKQLYEHIYQFRSKGSNYEHGIELDSTRYEWEAGNMTNMYTYYHDTLYYKTEYHYTDNSKGRQFSYGIPNKIDREIMYKNVARNGLILSKDFCTKIRGFDSRKNKYVDSTIIEPVFDKSNKLIQYNRHFYKENTGGWQTTNSYVELNYECF